jgi:hypothetical protein
MQGQFFASFVYFGVFPCSCLAFVGPVGRQPAQVNENTELQTINQLDHELQQLEQRAQQLPQQFYSSPSAASPQANWPQPVPLTALQTSEPKGATSIEPRQKLPALPVATAAAHEVEWQSQPQSSMEQLEQGAHWLPQQSYSASSTAAQQTSRSQPMPLASLQTFASKVATSAEPRQQMTALPAATGAVENVQWQPQPQESMQQQEPGAQQPPPSFYSGSSTAAAQHTNWPLPVPNAMASTEPRPQIAALPIASGAAVEESPWQPRPQVSEGTSCRCVRGNESAAATQPVNAPSIEFGDSCRFSKIVVHKDHGESSGLSFADVSALYGGDGGALTDAQRGMVSLAKVAGTSFHCLDDRVRELSIGTPGGDLGEFILALASYLQERDSAGRNKPTQAAVDSIFERYLETVPDSRPLIHCTDDRAISHLEATLPAENLDLRAPATIAKEAGLLSRLTQVDNQGDSHIRLMLKEPEWYQVGDYLVPMVLSAFYRSLWKQNQDPKHAALGNKLRLVVLSGMSNPQAFLEVSANQQCEKNGIVPMLVPNDGMRALLISHMDAVTERRGELAKFFSEVAAATPHKVAKDRLHQSMNRRGWLALETTGSRVAAGLPFYSLSYL